MLQNSVVMFQRPTSSLSAVLPEMDILLTVLGGAQVVILETNWLDYISSDTGLSLTDTFLLTQDRLQWRAVALATKAMRI